MAKLVKTYENGIEKTELTFRGETYDFSMLPCEHGRRSDKHGFDKQVTNKYPELKEEDELIDILDDLSWQYDEDDIFEALEALEEWEGEL